MVLISGNKAASGTQLQTQPVVLIRRETTHTIKSQSIIRNLMDRQSSQCPPRSTENDDCSVPYSAPHHEPIENTGFSIEPLLKSLFNILF